MDRDENSDQADDRELTEAAESRTEEPAEEIEEGLQEAKSIEIPLREYRELMVKAQEHDHYLLRLQRSVADYQNLIKRLDKVRDMAKRDAARRVAEAIGPLADSLALALQHSEQAEGGAGMTEGLQMVEKEFYAMLPALGIEPIKALGQPFDPHFHEAVMQQPADGVEPNTVVAELKKGFMLGDEVVRPTQVAVAANGADTQQQQRDGKTS